MMQKISGLPMAAYFALAGRAGALKKDERGLSGVVVAILLILVAVLAIVIIWGSLSGWLEDLWEQITGQAEQIS
ncbi:MAG: hypothetical protein FWB97_03100 [Oscillospiraceae bacterium]|nr:hypothetical protein [Oscillospiraceae bacterium]